MPINTIPVLIADFTALAVTAMTTPVITGERGLGAFARGVGAGLGPILARAWLGQEERRMRQAIAPSYLLVALFFLLLGWSNGLVIANIAVVGSFAAGSVLWVFSTVLLQMIVPDQFRGRVFATELALLMVVSALSSLAAGWALDYWTVSPFELIRGIGVLFILPTVGWLIIERQALKSRTRDQKPEDRSR